MKPIALAIVAMIAMMAILLVGTSNAYWHDPGWYLPCPGVTADGWCP